MIQASQGFANTLALLPWQVFSTYTFKNPLPKERCRWRLVWRHLHQVSEFLGVPYSRLLIAVRCEHGELGDRPHFHSLLGGWQSRNIHTEAHQMEDNWKRLTQGGHPVVRAYDRSLKGADYIEKCLGGGNLYELGKFNRSDRLELSASVFRCVEYRLRSYWQRESLSGNDGKHWFPGVDPVGAGELGRADRPAVAEVVLSHHTEAIDNPPLSLG